jgi:hypothetical protein
LIDFFFHAVITFPSDLFSNSSNWNWTIQLELDDFGLCVLSSFVLETQLLAFSRWHKKPAE